MNLYKQISHVSKNKMNDSDHIQFKRNMEELININNKIEESLESLRDLKECRNKLLIRINEQIQNNGLENKVFKLNEHKISPKRTAISQALSYKYIEECLNKHLGEETSNNIIQTIRDNRIKKWKDELKIEKI